MASVAQLKANRGNAQKSTGPKTAEGKAIVGANAIQTGMRSNRWLVEGEDPTEFEALCTDLIENLQPEGAIENALAERIALALWRQRRLIRAEVAAIDLGRRPAEIAKAVEGRYEPDFPSQVSSDDLQPFDEAQAGWCRAVLEEVEGLEEIRFDTLQSEAPLIHAQLMQDAAEDEEDPETYVASLQHGLTTYVADLAVWCRSQLKVAEMRPRLLECANQLRSKRLMLPAEQLEVLARYQTTLDNQLYKALRAFRDAQEWRMKTMDSVPKEQLSDARKPS